MFHYFVAFPSIFSCLKCKSSHFLLYIFVFSNLLRDHVHSHFDTWGRCIFLGGGWERGRLSGHFADGNGLSVFPLGSCMVSVSLRGIFSPVWCSFSLCGIFRLRGVGLACVAFFTCVAAFPHMHGSLFPASLSPKIGHQVGLGYGRGGGGR